MSQFDWSCPSATFPLRFVGRRCSRDRPLQRDDGPGDPFVRPFVPASIYRLYNIYTGRKRKQQSLYCSLFFITGGEKNKTNKNKTNTPLILLLLCRVMLHVVYDVHHIWVCTYARLAAGVFCMRCYTGRHSIRKAHIGKSLVLECRPV